MSDYAPLLDGDMTLKEAEAAGIDTAVIKKAKTRRRIIQREGQDPVVEIEREVELHDRSLAESEFTVEQTGGRATETVRVEGGPVAVVRCEFVGITAEVLGAWWMQLPQDEKDRMGFAGFAPIPAEQPMIEGEIVGTVVDDVKDALAAAQEDAPHTALEAMERERAKLAGE